MYHLVYNKNATTRVIVLRELLNVPTSLGIWKKKITLIVSEYDIEHWTILLLRSETHIDFI